MSSFLAITFAAYPHDLNLEPLPLAEALTLAETRVSELTDTDITSVTLLADALENQYGVEYVDDDQWLNDAKKVILDMATEFVHLRYADYPDPYVAVIDLDKPRLFTGEISYGDFGNEYVEKFGYLNSLALFEEPQTA